MIKMKGGNGGRNFVLLGLSEKNLENLRGGKPIHIFAEELGIGHDIIIAWGRTENALAAELSQHFKTTPTEVQKQ